jgi:hypothetical protein
MWARVNAAARLVNAAAVGWGFANPQLYRAGTGADAAKVFYDVTMGTNGYPATTGWDAATGLGVPDVAGLIGVLRATAQPFVPATATPLPACGLPQFSDPAGDTVDLLDDPADTPALDLRSGELRWDPTAGVLTGTLTLAADPTTIYAGSSGSRFVFHFKRGKEDLDLVATHLTAHVDYNDPTKSTPSETYHYSLASGTGVYPTDDEVPADAAPITGAFDAATKTVTVRVPASTLVAIHGGTFDATTVLTDLSAATAIDDNLVAYGGDDAASSPACQVVVGDTAPSTAPTKKPHPPKGPKH